MPRHLNDFEKGRIVDRLMRGMQIRAIATQFNIGERVAMSKIKNCAGKDSFERMNYLYQISNTTLSEGQDNTAAALYSNLTINISKKSVQRLEPEIKRSLCKKCHTLMIADVTAKVRIRNKCIRFNCKKCQSTKVLKALPDYVPWVQNPKAVVETLKY